MAITKQQRIDIYKQIIKDGTDEYILDTFSKEVQDNYNKTYLNKLQLLKPFSVSGKLCEISTEDELSNHLAHAFSSKKGWQ